jgi:hypothetical protein
MDRRFNPQGFWALLVRNGYQIAPAEKPAPRPTGYPYSLSNRCQGCGNLGPCDPFCPSIDY